MKALFLTACALTISLYSSAPAVGESAARLSVVLVTGRTATGVEGFASGVIIGVNGGLRIVTAAHVAQLDNLEVHTQLGETLAASHAQFVQGYDLAVLQTSIARSPYSAAQRAATIANEEVAEVWGYGDKMEPRMLPAVILATSIRFPGSGNLAKLGFACDRCEHGDSGAGIFDQTGALIGILSARWTDRDGRLSIMEGEPVSAVFDIMASK